MPLDLDRFELDSDDDEDGLINDFGNIGLPCQRIIHDIGRSLDEIMELEVKLINSCTDLSPEYWVKIYAKRFRDIMNWDSSLPEGRVKRILYANEHFGVNIEK